MIATELTEPPETVPATMDDLALVQHARRDLSAFATLYERHATQVYRYLLVRTGNVDDAQDLTSQTFLAAMQGLHSFRGDRPFPAWLLGIARNKTMDMFRRRRPALDLDAAGELAAEGDSTESMVGRRLEVEQVARHLQRLSPDRAEALSLRLFAGLEVKEIAQIMEKNEPAVRMLVFRGLRDLQEQMQEDG